MITRGLGELSQYLPYGYANLFAQRFGCSSSKIYKVASGKLVDYRILYALKEEAEANFKITQQIKTTNLKLVKK